MYRLLPRHGVFVWKQPLTSYENVTRRSVRKTAETLTTAENQKCLGVNSDDVLTASVTRSQTIPNVRGSLRHAGMVPLLESSSEMETFEVAPEVSVEKLTLPFEEIPGPAILKLWEKYWKYVPLLGTQLFCSLLINRFTQGRLSWNRNVTPIKYLFNEYGCIVRINGPIVGDIVMIHRPEHIAEVFKQEGDTPVRSGIDVLQHYRLNYRKYRMAGAFSLQGSEWLELREKIDKPFNEIATNFFGKLELICDELVNGIHKIRNRQGEVPVTFHEDLTRWATECFYTLVFNKRLGFLNSTNLDAVSDPTRMINALKTAHTYLSRCETGFQVWRFFETPFSKKLFAACDVLDEIIGKYIRMAYNELQSRSKCEKRHDSREEDCSLIEKLFFNQINSDDISTLLMDILLLGVQPTANCQGFLLYFLAKNPRVQRKLYDEIMSVQPNGSLTEEDLKCMSYLKACLQESFRLRPAFPYITRHLPKTISLHGYTIPKGTFVIMANQITSQCEENFEDPEKFRPERWLSNETHDSPYQEFSCLHFGHGLRSCLGRKMAEMEIMLLTAKLIREFRIEYDYADIGSSFLMVNVPNKPLRFRFINRN